MPTQIGQRVGQLTVEQAVVSTLDTWLATYVTAAARRYDIDDALLADYSFPFRPRGITVAKNFDDWPVNALPHIQVLSPGWTPAGGDETGKHVKYQIQVVCLAGAQNQDDTRLIRACYEDAIPGVLMQHQSLGGLAAGIDLVGGGSADLDQVDEKDARTFQGSITVFEVLVMGVLDPVAGPAQPDPIPDVDNVPPTPYPGDPVLDDEDNITATVVPQEVT